MGLSSILLHTLTLTVLLDAVVILTFLYCFFKLKSGTKGMKLLAWGFCAHLLAFVVPLWFLFLPLVFDKMAHLLLLFGEYPAAIFKFIGSVLIIMGARELYKNAQAT